MSAPNYTCKEELKLLLKFKDNKIKTLNQKPRRKENKVASLNDCLKEMKDKELVGPVAAAQLEEPFSGLLSEIILNHFNNQDKSSRGNRHSDQAKKFAFLFTQCVRACSFSFSFTAPKKINNRMI